MVISVLERRSEIGLRHALGATKGHIRTQFLSEAILLALARGIIGIGIGALATTIYAHAKGWATVIPTDAWTASLAATILIGALAGLLPALRPARLNPTEALWTRYWHIPGRGKPFVKCTGQFQRRTSRSVRPARPMLTGGWPHRTSRSCGRLRTAVITDPRAPTSRSGRSILVRAVPLSWRRWPAAARGAGYGLVMPAARRTSPEDAVRPGNF